jgi:5-methylcytosine-specific restriction protein A
LNLDENFVPGYDSPAIKFKLESPANAFVLKLTRSWKTTQIEFIPAPFANQVVSFLCQKIVQHRDELTNLLHNGKNMYSHYEFEVDGLKFNNIEKLDTSPHALNFKLEVLTEESSLSYGLLNEKESSLIELAVSMFAAILPDPINSYTSPDEVIGYPEGASTPVLVNKYERDPRNRAAAIAIHGHKCAACEFNFKETYGQLGEDFIIVHHVTPVSQIGDDYVINPATDLITLCANCHSMVHRENPPLSVAQLRNLLAKSDD